MRHTSADGPVSRAVRDDPVLRAAHGAVIDFGVRRTTLAEVARRAGVSRMTVYRRYDDLSQLLSTLLTLELGQVVASVEGDVGALPDARARVATLVAQVTRAVAGHPLLRRVLDVDPEALMPLVVDRLGSSQRLALEHLSSAMVAGMASRGGDGSVRDGDPALLALTLVVAAQSFVFSARVVEGEDARAYDELHRLADAYLAPAGAG